MAIAPAMTNRLRKAPLTKKLRSARAMVIVTNSVLLNAYSRNVLEEFVYALVFHSQERNWWGSLAQPRMTAKATVLDGLVVLVVTASAMIMLPKYTLMLKDQPPFPVTNTVIVKINVIRSVKSNYEMSRTKFVLARVLRSPLPPMVHRNFKLLALSASKK
ncbi:unnamed protein product [Ilex paraguariensis]|uniref:Uncharacterized protein n=1 Tax=Ilex paraguariensis TaxID=185542 RepID=A0ABC8RW94_9AQUA